MGKTTPTLFVDYDGTLHGGHALIDMNGQITLDSGRPLFEFAPLLVEMLEPYPSVEIVLTTSWLQRMPTETVISYLPPELARRVVDTTKSIKPRLSFVLNGSERTYVIASYAYGHSLKNWLAIDDTVYGAADFGRKPGELLKHFLLLDSTRGISAEYAQQRIREWLVDVHRQSKPTDVQDLEDQLWLAKADAARHEGFASDGALRAFLNVDMNLDYEPKKGDV